MEPDQIDGDKSLETRVADLEGEIRALRRSVADLTTISRGAKIIQAPPPPPHSPRPSTPAVGVATSMPVGAATAPSTPAASPVSSEAALKWGGIGLVVLGVVFAVSTAISRGWIGPEIQLAGAVAFALALLAQGLRMRGHRPSHPETLNHDRQRAWSDAFFVGGILSLYATFASSLFVYLTSTGAGLLAALGVGAIGFALAGTTMSEWAGLATVGTAGAVGLVLDLSDRSQATSAAWALGFTTVGLILASVLGLYRVRLAAQLLGLVAASAVIAANGGGGLGPVDLVVLAVVTVSLLLAPSIGPRLRLSQRIEIQLSLWLAPWLGLMAGVAIGDLSDRSAGLVYLISAGLVAITAAALGQAATIGWSAARVHVSSLLIGAGVATTIAMAFLINGRPFFLAAAAQGLGLMYLYRRFEPSPRILVNSLLLFALAAGFCLATSIGAWVEPAPVSTLAINLGILMLGAAGLYLAPIPALRSVGALGLLGATMAYVGSVLVHLPQGQAAVSLVWALIGVGVLLAGAQQKNQSAGLVGLGVLGVTVAKLLTVDLAEVDTLWRAGLFLVVGLGLLRLGLSLPRLMGQDQDSNQAQGSHP